MKISALITEIGNEWLASGLVPVGSHRYNPSYVQLNFPATFWNNDDNNWESSQIGGEVI